MIKERKVKIACPPQYVKNFITQLEEKLLETIDEDDVNIKRIVEYACGNIYSVVVHAPSKEVIKIIDEFCKHFIGLLSILHEITSKMKSE